MKKKTKRIAVLCVDATPRWMHGHTIADQVGCQNPGVMAMAMLSRRLHDLLLFLEDHDIFFHVHR